MVGAAAVTEPAPVLDPRAAGGKRLRDRIAIVTGAGQGIGRATSRRMAEEGARVMIADQHQAGAERTCNELRAYGVDADTFVGDLSGSHTARELMAATIARFGHIDTLVNCAGGAMYAGKPGWQYTPEEMVANVQNNFWTTMWCCWAVLPHMVERRSGAIVNIASNAVRGTERLPYAASKGGVIAMTTSLALETATLGVRINCVAPFWSAKPLGDALFAREPGRLGPQTQEEWQAWYDRLAAKFLPQIPMRRAGTMEEQAAAITFLASDDASFITGQILTVGGGATVP